MSMTEVYSSFFSLDQNQASHFVVSFSNEGLAEIILIFSNKLKFQTQENI